MHLRTDMSVTAAYATLHYKQSSWAVVTTKPQYTVSLGHKWPTVTVLQVPATP